MSRFIGDEERRARLALRHHLAQPTSDPSTVASDLVGIHSTDASSVYLSVWARQVDFIPEDLEHALYEERSLLRMLGMRRTVFVVPLDLAATIDASCSRALLAGERRRLVGLLEAQDLTADGETWLTNAMDRVEAALEARGTATARQLKHDVPELDERIAFGEGKKWAGTIGMSTRVLFLLATEGRIVRARPLGTWASSQHRWSTTRQWLGGPLRSIDVAEAERDLVRRWLERYGPGTERDLVWWTGWGIRKTRAAIAAVAEEVELADATGYVVRGDLAAPESVEPWIALLPSLDSTVMGWKDRDWYLGDLGPALYDRNGNAGPTVWADGAIVGGWGQRSSGEVIFRLLRDVGTETADRIAAEAARLEEWLGDMRIKARFRTPLERELTG